MSGYSVDEIIEELRKKHDVNKGRNTAAEKILQSLAAGEVGKAKEASVKKFVIKNPIIESGKDPVPSAETAPPSADGFATRIDLALEGKRFEDGPAGDMGATRVLQTEKPRDKQTFEMGPAGNIKFDANRFVRIMEGATDALPELSLMPEDRPKKPTRAERKSGLAINDFEQYADSPSIKKDLLAQRRSLTFRFLFLFVMLVLGVTLTAVSAERLPQFISPGLHPAGFVAAGLALLLLAALVSANTVANGIISLFKFKANSDAMAAAAVLACTAQALYLIFNVGDTPVNTVPLYFPLAIGALLFNTLGKRMLVRAAEKNFALIALPRDKDAAAFVDDGQFAADLTRGMGLDEPQVLYRKPTKFLKNFLGIAYDNTLEQKTHRVLAPVCVLFSALAGVVSYILFSDVNAALGAFAAALCVTVPITSTITGNYPFLRAANALTPRGNVLTGAASVEAFSDADAVLISSDELFPAGSVTLHGIKPFGDLRIDNAIVDAASVLIACKSPLGRLFDSVIAGNAGMLKAVDTVVYEDGLGISAWVDSKRVLVGNRELLIHHGISIPEKLNEDKFRVGNRQIVYLANSGELSAIFSVSYAADPAVAKAISALAGLKKSILIRTADPNVTQELASSLFGLPAGQIRIVPSRSHGGFMELDTVSESEDALGMTNGKLIGFAEVIDGACAVNSAVNIALGIQTAALILGYVILAFFAFAGTAEKLTVLSIFVYQAVWALAVVLTIWLRRFGLGRAR